MNKKKELAKNTFIILAGKVSTQMITFFMLPLYTSYLLTEEYGLVDLITTYVTLIIPIITLMAFLCSKLSLSIDEISSFFSYILPKNVEELLLSIFSGVDASNIGIGVILLGIYLASNGLDSIIIASNTLYNTPNKTYFKRRGKALLLTIVLILLLLFILVVLAFGNIILKFVLSLDMFASVADLYYKIFLVLKWPIALLFIYFLIRRLYLMAPDIDVPKKIVNYGSIFATCGIVISSAIYSFYVNNIADYKYIYGNLSNIIVLMILIYVVAYILVIGIAINANMYELENKNNLEKEKV